MELIDTLIEARWIIPIVPKGVILENSALAVNAGRIVDILPIETAEKTYQAQQVFRFPTSALLVLPAYAGMFHRGSVAAAKCFCSPRVCGDVSKFRNLLS